MMRGSRWSASYPVQAEKCGACVTECRLRVCESVVLSYVFSPPLELSLAASFYSRKEEARST